MGFYTEAAFGASARRSLCRDYKERATYLVKRAGISTLDQCVMGSIGIAPRAEAMTWLEYNEAFQQLRPESEVVVGTGAQASWRLRRADLMPRHFIVTTSNGGVTIRPFSSDTVVTVNGRQLPTGMSELHDGDIIGAGSAEFYFWAVSPGETPRAIKAPITAHLVDARRRSALSLHRISTGIGRDESNVLVVDDEGASSFHAEVRREAGGHALRTSDPASAEGEWPPRIGAGAAERGRRDPDREPTPALHPRAAARRNGSVGVGEYNERAWRRCGRVEGAAAEDIADDRPLLGGYDAHADARRSVRELGNRGGGDRNARLIASRSVTRVLAC